MSFFKKTKMAAAILFGSQEIIPTSKEIKKNNDELFSENISYDNLIDNSDYEEYLNSSPPVINRKEYVFDKLQFGDFPVLEEGKIKNADNLIAIKEKYVRQAFEAIRPYYDYVLHLSPISMNEEYAKCLLHIITRLIAIYWDMPASRNHHDNGDFGLLKHAVHTGTREAMRLCLLNRYSKLAGVDSEATRKIRPKVVIAGFIVGMLHDADKMLQFKLTCSMVSGVNEFNPLFGSGAVLDFKLKYPRDKMNLEWINNKHKSLNMGLHYLYSPVVPAVFRKSLDGELLEFIFTCMKNYKSRSDQIAAQFSQAHDSYLNDIRVGLTRILAMDSPVNDLDGNLFKMSNNWYMAIQDRFISALNTEVRATENAVERVLVEYGVLKSRGKNDFNGHRFSLNLLYPGARYEKKYSVSFYQSSFIDTLPVFNNERVGLAPIKISAAQADFLKGVGIDLPASAFAGNKNSEQEKTPHAVQDAPLFVGEKIPPQEAPGLRLDASPTPEPQKEKESQEKPVKAAKNTAKEEQRLLPPEKEKPKKTHPMAPVTRKEFEAQAVQGIKEQNEGYKTIPHLPANRVQAYQAQFNPAMFNALPNIEMALAESLANGVGATVPNNSTFPALHLQSTNSPKTIFYIQENRTLLARHPNAIKFAWGVMMYQHQEGEHGWLKNIPDLPISISGAEHSSNLLLNYFYLAWAKKGVLIPEGNNNTFTLSDHLIPIIEKKGKDPVISLEKINGNFISLDLIALLSCETKRVGTKSLDQTIRYHYKSIYNSEWA